MRTTLIGVTAVLLAVAYWVLRDRGEAEPIRAAQDMALDVPRSESVQESKSAAGQASISVAAPREGSAPSAMVGGRFSRDPGYYLQARPMSESQFAGQIEVPPLQLPPPLRTQRHPGALRATSPEEAAWLDRKGFPTEEELESLDEVSEQDLAEQAARGDVTAMALLGEKQLRSNKIEEGYSNLEEAALLGSIWAVLQLGDWQKRIGNWQNALAYYQLAALLGDWYTPSLHMQTGLPKEIKTASLRSLPADTAKMYAGIQYQRARRGLPPLTVDTRPHPFNHLRGLDPVGIYPRAREQRQR